MKPAEYAIRRKNKRRTANPLIEQRMSRTDCLRRLEENGFRRPPKSNGFICPVHSNFFWRELYKNLPAGFDEACRFDGRPGDSTKRKL